MLFRSRQIAAAPQGSSIDPRWSPDGTRVVFVVTPATDPTAAPPPDAGSQIYVLDLATGAVRKLT